MSNLRNPGFHATVGASSSSVREGESTYLEQMSSSGFVVRLKAQLRKVTMDYEALKQEHQSANDYFLAQSQAYNKLSDHYQQRYAQQDLAEVALRDELQKAKRIISGQNVELERYNRAGQVKPSIQAVQMMPLPEAYVYCAGTSPKEPIGLQFRASSLPNTRDLQIGVKQYDTAPQDQTSATFEPSIQAGVQPTSASRDIPVSEFQSSVEDQGKKRSMDGQGGGATKKQRRSKQDQPVKT